MTRRKTPKVARPKGLRRGVELLKDLLILLLTCSALFLAWQTPMLNQLQGWIAPPAPVYIEPSARSEEALTPYALRVQNSLGAYAVSYDGPTLTRVFQRFSSLLGEALTTTETPEQANLRQWQALLEAPGLYCALRGTLPLSLLPEWLGMEGAVSGRADALVLAWDGAWVWLGWREGNSFYRVRTQVDFAGELGRLVEDFSPNGGAFAYTLSEDSAFEALDPYVLITPTVPQPKRYTAAAPDLTGDAETLTRLLNALGFLSGAGDAYETPGGLTVTENGDRLQVTAAGRVTYRAGEEPRFPVNGPSAAQAAQAAWELLCRVAEPFENTPAYLLTGVEPTEGMGWTVTFEARLDGIPMTTGASGWCARFTVEEGRITEFTLTLRTYTPTGEITPVPDHRLAAAALRSIPESDGSLVLCYTDNLSPGLTVGWMTQE